MRIAKIFHKQTELLNYNILNWDIFFISEIIGHLSVISYSIKISIIQLSYE